MPDAREVSSTSRRQMRRQTARTPPSASVSKASRRGCGSSAAPANPRSEPSYSGGEGKSSPIAKVYARSSCGPREGTVVPDTTSQEATVEARWEAAPAVLLVIAGQVVMAIVSHQRDWSLWRLPWWSWLLLIGPELLLLIPLALTWPRRQLEEIGMRREATLALFAVVGVGNGLALGALLVALLGGREQDGTQLLLKAVTIWTTNVIAFGLCYWTFDRGGPVRRREPDPPPPDFQFPQMENPELAAPGWHPRLVDYLYVSFTNSIAFSPTDAMPLTHQAKLLMVLESAVSSVTILLCAARGVNILR
jgi:hypothetical protein